MEWDQPLTEQDLQAIDAAFQSATSSLNKKRRCSLDDQDHAVISDRHKTLRRLPNSLVALQHTNPPLSPCHEMNARKILPALKFEGHVVYSRTAMEVEKAAEKLLKNLETRKRELGEVVLGLDIEWRPTFRRGVSPGKAAVMQICMDTSHCHVMHIFHSGITRSLQFLLEDPLISKVGVGIGNDAVKVFKDYNVSIKAAEDLSDLASQKLGECPHKWSLGSLTEFLISKELQKPKSIRLGNWETNFLSKKQLEYAATDAFASWHLYQVLKSLPSREEVGPDEGIKDLKGSQCNVVRMLALVAIWLDLDSLVWAVVEFDRTSDKPDR